MESVSLSCVKCDLPIICYAGLDNKVVSDMYYIGEVEEEVRRLKWTSSRTFDDNNLGPLMDAIEEERHTYLYSHQCSQYCKDRGMYVSAM